SSLTGTVITSTENVGVLILTSPLRLQAQLALVGIADSSYRWVCFAHLNLVSKYHDLPKHLHLHRHLHIHMVHGGWCLRRPSWKRLGDGELTIGTVWNNRLTRRKTKSFVIELHRDYVWLERDQVGDAADL